MARAAGLLAVSAFGILLSAEFTRTLAGLVPARHARTLLAEAMTGSHPSTLGPHFHDALGSVFLAAGACAAAAGLIAFFTVGPLPPRRT